MKFYDQEKRYGFLSNLLFFNELFLFLVGLWQFKLKLLHVVNSVFLKFFIQWILNVVLSVGNVNNCAIAAGRYFLSYLRKYSQNPFRKFSIEQKDKWTNEQLHCYALFEAFKISLNNFIVYTWNNLKIIAWTIMPFFAQLHSIETNESKKDDRQTEREREKGEE